VSNTKNLSFVARFRFACAGLSAALRSEMSMRVHVAAFALLLAVLVAFRPEPLWWALAILASAAVITTVWRHNSHADVVVGKYLEGFRQDGKSAGPRSKIVSPATSVAS